MTAEDGDLGRTKVLAVGREELKADDVVAVDLRKVEPKLGPIITTRNDELAEHLKRKDLVLVLDGGSSRDSDESCLRRRPKLFVVLHLQHKP